MELGADFEDDFFEEPKQRLKNGPSNYEFELVKPFWFMEVNLKNKEPSEALVTLKNQADHYYGSRSYAKAAIAYEQCLEILPSNNGTWRREFMENLARAHLSMDQPEKALEWSFKLDKASINADQKVVAMNLLATVCHRLRKYAEELEALHFCLETHKLVPEFWQRLALCYAGLFKLNLPEYSAAPPSPLDPPAEDSSPQEEPCCEFKAKLDSISPPVPSDRLVCPEVEERLEVLGPVCSEKCELCILGIQIVSSCLIRTRMLMDSGGPGHLTAQRDERLKEKIANSLIHMEVDQDFIDVASQMLGGEFSSILQRPDSTLEEQSSISNHTEQDHKSDV